MLCAGYESVMPPPDPVNGPGEDQGPVMPFGWAHRDLVQQRERTDVGGGWML